MTDLNPETALALAALLWAHWAHDVGAVTPGEAFCLLLESARPTTPPTP